jgi:putative acetyltransferase
MTVSFRPITAADNPMLADIIRSVLGEFGLQGAGYACNDPETDAMYETYSRSHSYYLVVEKNGCVLGGGGIAPLRGGAEGICELQKLYLLPECRGTGQGRMLLAALLDQAKQRGYHYCYLETVPEMTAAHRLYEKMGFTLIDKAMGNTGHHACTVRYGCTL